MPALGYELFLRVLRLSLTSEMKKKNRNKKNPVILLISIKQLLRIDILILKESQHLPSREGSMVFASAGAAA